MGIIPVILVCFNCLLYRWNIALNADTQLQITAERPQAVGNAFDLGGDGLAAMPGAADDVEVTPLVRQGVDLRL